MISKSIKAFNVDSLSSVSNAELSNLATAASIATIWFLMTNNYNMVNNLKNQTVMIKTVA